MKNDLRSLAVFVGTGKCNARCLHCAGKIHRKYAPKEDGIINEELIYETLKDCYEKGASRLSISSSGEPTLSPLSVTKVLELVEKCKKENMGYSHIHLYSNGIRIGKDRDFCEEYLPKWKNLGLDAFYITVHDTDKEKNSKIYGIKDYPDLEIILSRIHDAGLWARANVVLSKKTIDTCEKFKALVNRLNDVGFDSIASWPIRNSEDEIDPGLSPIEEELRMIEEYAKNNPLKLSFFGEKHKKVYQSGQKLTLFPDGTLSNSWCA